MYNADSSDKADVRVESMEEQVVRAANSRLFNPEWIANMKKNGYRGASELSKTVTTMFGWQSTSGVVEDQVFDRLVETYVDNRENREFLAESNPYALEEIERRLLEANSRGIWNTSDDLLKRLQDDYLRLEADLESAAGEGEFQGGSVDVITSDKVDHWGESLKSAAEAVESMKKPITVYKE